MDAKAILELNTTSGWKSVDSDLEDVLILDVGEQNSVSLGNINTTQNISYVLKANKAGLNNVLRCSVTSTYDNFTGIQYTFINVTDVEIPIINSHNATPSAVEKFENITYYANVTDNVEVDSVIVEVGGVNYTMVFDTGDVYSYTLNTSILTGGIQNYTIYANDTSDNFAVIATDEFTVYSRDLLISNVNFENIIVVGEDTIVQVNVTNSEYTDALNALLNVSIYLYNGAYVINESLTQFVNVSAQSSYLVNITWTAKVGNVRFDIDVDVTDVVLELNETNNALTVYRDVLSSEVLYGSVANYQRVLFDGGNNGFTTWSLATPVGVSYYADIDANWLPSNLAVFTQANDYNESDSDLGLTNYNDSNQKLYDANDDGVADQTRNISLGGTYYDVPVINSTNSSTFVTGILFDSADGIPYDGTQDLIFIAIFNGSQVGKYGTYDYEVRVPYTLGQQVAGTNVVERLDEIN